ncbi:MAG: hypothetical protein ACKOB4_16820 [Acidobacteriota bacterium]
MVSLNQLRHVTLLTLAAASLCGLAGCRKGVDLESGAPTSTPVVQSAAPTPTPDPSLSTQPGQQVQPGQPELAQPAGAASPVKPGEVPEMMKRAFTKEEMDKAMQQLPPEIRDRLKGMSYSPSNIPATIPATPPAKKK